MQQVCCAPLSNLFKAFMGGKKITPSKTITADLKIVVVPLKAFLHSSDYAISY
jgi:hypothetical protein